MSIVTPDTILYNTIEGILKKIPENFNQYSDKSKTILYKLTNGVNLGDYDFYEQAKEVFFKDKGARRAIDLRVGWDQTRTQLPTIYINMPSEDKGPEDGLGVDEGVDTFFDTNEKIYKNIYQRSFMSRYSVVITSNIRNEVVMIYYILKSMLIPLIDHLEMSGLKNPKLSGKDLGMGDGNLVPKTIMLRTLNIDFYYNQSVEDIFDYNYIKDFSFEGDAYLDNSFNKLDNS